MTLAVDSEILRKKFRQLLNERADTLATGGVADWGAYQKMVGVVEGLALAERELLDLVEVAKKSQGDMEDE